MALSFGSNGSSANDPVADVHASCKGGPASFPWATTPGCYAGLIPSWVVNRTPESWVRRPLDG